MRLFATGTPCYGLRGLRLLAANDRVDSTKHVLRFPHGFPGGGGPGLGPGGGDPDRFGFS